MLITLPLLDTSDASKAHSKEVLENLGGDDAFYSQGEQNADKGQQLSPRFLSLFLWLAADLEQDPTRVAAGLKATINNPTISQSTKEQAQEKLDNM